MAFKRKALVATATIQPDFEPAMIALYRRKLAEMVKMARVSRRMDENQQRVARYIRDYLKSAEERERIVTVLRGLPFTEYGVRKHGGLTWFYGLTQPIVMDEFTGYDATTVQRKWDIGPYYIFISDQYMLGGSTDEAHMIPLRKLNAVNRHPHHIVQRPADNPIACKVHTCVGNWGPMLLGLKNNFNLPELFRTYYIFLARFNEGSPLANPRRYPEMQEFMKVIT